MASLRWILLLPIVGFTAGVLLTGSALVASPPRAQASSAPVSQFPVPARSTNADAAPAKSLLVDALQVSVADYDTCVRAGACATYASASSPDHDDAGRHWESAWCNGGRLNRRDVPMNCVDWRQAAAYCRWVGKRLPTKDEWLDAARALQDSAGEAWSREALRRRDEVRSGMPPEEWTAGSEGPGPEAADAALRQACGSRPIEGLKPVEWYAWCAWHSVVSRRPHLSFRCVR